MEIHFTCDQINWLSVIVATVASFLIGSLWYSPVLFGNTWQKEIKLSKDDLKGANMTKIFSLAFILQFIGAIALDIFIGVNGTLVSGIITGLVVSIAWISTALGTNYLFAQKSFKLFLIDSFYYIVLFIVMGVILGVW